MRTLHMGSLQKASITNFHLAIVERAVGPIDTENKFKFKRLQTKTDILHCTEYKAVTKRNSCTVQYIGPNGKDAYCHIHFYLKATKRCPNKVFCSNTCVCKKPAYVALGSEIELNKDLHLSKDGFTKATAAHIIPCKTPQNSRKVVFDVCTTKSIFVEVHNEFHFVCLPPNRVERD